MSTDYIILAVSIVIVAATLALAALHNVFWVWVTVFVLANLVRGGTTGRCPQARALVRLGFKPGRAFV